MTDKETPEERATRVREWVKLNPNPFISKFQAKTAELTSKYGPDFRDKAEGFQVNKAEQMVINEWLASLKSEIIAKEKSMGLSDPLGGNEPYYGAIGGGVSYTFTPTGLGDILVVKETITGKQLNVTEALEWFFFG